MLTLAGCCVQGIEEEAIWQLREEAQSKPSKVNPIFPVFLLYYTVRITIRTPHINKLVSPFSILALKARLFGGNHA